MRQPSPLELLLYLNSLGNVVPLTPYFQPGALLEELRSFDSSWQPYNRHKTGNRRWGLSLTSLDGGLSGDPDLYSLKDYNDIHATCYREDQFTTTTPAFHASLELQKAVEHVGTLGRSHILRMGQGGFFPPHRDNALLEPECFRLFASFNANFDHYSFVLDDKQHFFDSGSLYLINTTLPHSLMSFHDYAHFLVLNIPLTVENVGHVTTLLCQN